MWLYVRGVRAFLILLLYSVFLFLVSVGRAVTAVYIRYVHRLNTPFFSPSFELDF